jgi:hypothetical protein
MNATKRIGCNAELRQHTKAGTGIQTEWRWEIWDLGREIEKNNYTEKTIMPNPASYDTKTTTNNTTTITATTATTTTTTTRR